MSASTPNARGSNLYYPSTAVRAAQTYSKGHQRPLSRTLDTSVLNNVIGEAFTTKTFSSAGEKVLEVPKAAGSTYAIVNIGPARPDPTRPDCIPEKYSVTPAEFHAAYRSFVSKLEAAVILFQDQKESRVSPDPVTVRDSRVAFSQYGASSIT